MAYREGDSGPFPFYLGIGVEAISNGSDFGIFGEGMVAR